MSALGHDAVHTLDLPAGNRTRDAEICRIADEQKRIVISNDGDFIASHIVLGSPAKLLWVATGNISNNDLVGLFDAQMEQLQTLFAQASCVELGSSSLAVHS